MARVLEREGARLGFSRNFRASLDRVGGIKFEVPDIEQQNSFMAEVLKLEALIRENQDMLKTFAGRKESVLKKYLS